MNAMPVKEIHRMINRAIVMMGDMYGGMIKMCDIFGVNEENKFENFKVRHKSIHRLNRSTYKTYSSMELVTVNINLVC